MTQNTQTTADRIFELMREIRLWDVEHDATDHRAVANTIAAEIDTLTRERDEARQDHDRVYHDAEELAAEVMQTREQRNEALAEVERLRPAAEAWEAQRAQRVAFDKFDGKPTAENRHELTAANQAMLRTDAAARARAAKSDALAHEAALRAQHVRGDA